MNLMICQDYRQDYHCAEVFCNHDLLITLPAEDTRYAVGLAQLDIKPGF